MRNLNLGVPRRDTILYVLGTIVTIGFVLVWHLFMLDIIGNSLLWDPQTNNKYFVTVVMFGIAVVITLLSLGAGVVSGGRAAMRGVLPGILTRFGLALEIFGIAITPIAVYFSGDPQRSVPLGFAAFTTVFAGLILAGIGGNMLAPRRA